jgi:hypothetical protein
VPRHIARLVVDYFAYAMHLALARLFTWIVDDYFAYAMRLALARLFTWIVDDYFTYTVHLALAWLVTRLVARLVVDYFDYAARPSASARRVSCRAARRAARRRLLLPRAGSSSTTSPTPVASARRAARHDYLSRGNTSFTLSTPRTAATSSSGRIATTIHLD